MATSSNRHSLKSPSYLPRIFSLKTLLISACVFASFHSLQSHAQIYKWVDANGKTHFSDKKELSGKKPVIEIQNSNKSTTQTPAKKDNDSNDNNESWQKKNEAFKERQTQKEMKEQTNNTATKPPTSLTGGRSDGSNERNCNLAKDVLNGSVKRRNNIGKPTDKTDLESAEREKKMFCK